MGIFVGGRSRRMGAPKGRLPAPATGAALIDALVEVARAVGLSPVLVGDATPYADLARGVPRLADDPPGIGPLGGLRALLAHAPGTAVAVACDMPSVSAAALKELLEHPSAAPVVAARRGPRAPWEPLFARYDAPRVRAPLDRAVSAGTRSFQRFLAGVEVDPLPMTPAIERALVDWDRPEDIA